MQVNKRMKRYKDLEVYKNRKRLAINQKPVTSNCNYYETLAKNTTSLKEVELFTVGNDRDFDAQLAPFDVWEILHTQNVSDCGFAYKYEADVLVTELNQFIKALSFRLSAFSLTSEDIHSQIDFY